MNNRLSCYLNLAIDDTFNLSDNYEDGLVLEIALHHALNDLRITDMHNPFAPRQYWMDSGVGVDSIFSYNGVTYGCECKNLGSYVGYSFVKKHIDNRYSKCSVNKRFVVISKLNYLSSKAVKSLLRKDYQFISVGFKTSWYNIKKAIYNIKSQLRYLLHMPPLSLDVSNYMLDYTVNMLDNTDYMSLDVMLVGTDYFDIMIGDDCYDGQYVNDVNLGCG